MHGPSWSFFRTSNRDSKTSWRYSASWLGAIMFSQFSLTVVLSAALDMESHSISLAFPDQHRVLWYQPSCLPTSFPLNELLSCTWQFMSSVFIFRASSGVPDLELGKINWVPFPVAPSTWKGRECVDYCTRNRSVCNSLKWKKKCDCLFRHLQNDAGCLPQLSFIKTISRNVWTR